MSVSRDMPSVGLVGFRFGVRPLMVRDLCSVARQVRDAGLRGISYVRGGFFTGKTEKERRDALEENRQLIREAEILELPSLVLVCGATVGQIRGKTMNKFATVLG